MLTGLKCEAPAIRDKNYCRHHIRFYDANDFPAGRTDYTPAVPDQPEAALLSVHQATRAFLAGKIDAPTCRLLIYAAQVSSHIMGQRLAHDRHAEQLDREQLKEIAAEERAEAVAKALVQSINNLECSPEIMQQIGDHIRLLMDRARSVLPAASEPPRAEAS